MSRVEKLSTTFKLTAGEKAALQELAIAGYVLDPTNYDERSQVGVFRKMLRDAWGSCEQTKDKPFPEG